MKRPDIYTILGWIAIVAVPIAPAFFFGHKVYTAVVQLQDAARWAFPVGVLSALGLELVGILAGHIAMDYWRRNDHWRAGIAGLIMLIYVIIGVYELRGTIGAVMFLIAPLVYVLVALRHSLQVVEAQEAPVKQRRLEFDLEQEAKDKDWERQQKAGQAQRDHETKLAQIDADTRLKAEQAKHRASIKLARERAKLAESQHKPTESHPELAQEQFECEDCNRVFGSVQGLNAHMRFCPAREPAESKIKANGG